VFGEVDQYSIVLVGYIWAFLSFFVGPRNILELKFIIFVQRFYGPSMSFQPSLAATFLLLLGSIATTFIMYMMFTPPFLIFPHHFFVVFKNSYSAPLITPLSSLSKHPLDPTSSSSSKHFLTFSFTSTITLPCLSLSFLSYCTHIAFALTTSLLFCSCVSRYDEN